VDDPEAAMHRAGAWCTENGEISPGFRGGRKCLLTTAASYVEFVV
jgi:hypothetical protein